MQKFVREFHYLDPQQLPVLQAVSFGSGSQSYYWDASIRKERLVVLQVTLKGMGYLKHHGKTYSLPQGSAFLAGFPSNFQYYGEDWEFFYVEFSPNFKQWLETPVHIFSLDAESISEWKKLIFELKERQLSVYENSELAFLKFLQLKSLIHERQQKKHTLMTEVKTYIEETYREDLSLEEIAQRFSLTKYQLIRQYEAAYQITPIHYLRKVRLEKAIDLLWEERPIHEIARKVGYANGNYFSKVFKAEFGMSPSEYRNNRKRYGI